MKVIPIQDITRKCGECTACCEGWLEADINGHKMYKGKPCHYVMQNEGCSIYETRPETPCKVFRCLWLDAHDLTDDMRPDKSKVMLRVDNIEDIFFIRATELGQKVDSVVLAKMLQFAFHRRINILYEVDGLSYPMGDEKFLKVIKNYLRPA